MAFTFAVGTAGAETTKEKWIKKMKTEADREANENKDGGEASSFSSLTL